MKTKNKKMIASWEIFLLVSFSFALAFIFSESLVSAQVEYGVLVDNSFAPVVEGSGAATHYAVDGKVFTVAGDKLAGSVGSDGLFTPLKGVTTAAPAKSTATGFGGILKGSTFGTTGFGGVASSLLSGAAWGAAVGFGVYMIASLFGLDKKQASSLGMAAGGGTFAGTTSMFLAQHYVANHVGTTAFSSFTPGMFGLTIGIAVGVAILFATYKKEKKELVKFECLPWEAPLGGSQCATCNDNPYMPCSEYRCKSLGQGCELINKGSTEETCVWITKGDTAAPHMTPSNEALKPENLKYIPDATISPPNRGFKIIGENTECLQAFTKLEFGFTTDEPAQCRIDIGPKAKYDDMQFLFGNSNLFLKNHSAVLPVVNSENEEGDVAPEIGQDGTYTLWTRCIDSNGNGQDSAMVAFRYCVQKGPDTIAPEVRGSSIRTNGFVQYNVDAVPMEIYTNEPAECKWSRQDKDFDSMENTMSCATSIYQVNSNLDYVCSGSLSGVENSKDNLFYFRCKDYSRAPGGRNVMTTSFPLLLKGTQQLTIKSVGPTGEFSGTTTVIPVTLRAETSHGAEEGKATCYFSPDGDSDTFVPMDNSDNYLHNQTLDLTTGTYNYYFRCVDAGGNSVDSNTTFTVFTDTSAPVITRAFRDGTSLKVITDEDATCYYSETSCTYDIETGLPMSKENPQDKTVHSIAWKEGVSYHIKCADDKGNEPRPDFCQIIAKASEL